MLKVNDFFVNCIFFIKKTGSSEPVLN